MFDLFLFLGEVGIVQAYTDRYYYEHMSILKVSLAD